MNGGILGVFIGAPLGLVASVTFGAAPTAGHRQLRRRFGLTGVLIGIVCTAAFDVFPLGPSTLLGPRLPLVVRLIGAAISVGLLGWWWGRRFALAHLRDAAMQRSGAADLEGRTGRPRGVHGWLFEDRHPAPGCAGVAVAGAVVVVLVAFFVLVLMDAQRNDRWERPVLRRYVAALRIQGARELARDEGCASSDQVLWEARRQLQLSGTRKAALATVAAEAHRQGWVDHGPAELVRSGAFQELDRPEGFVLDVSVTGSDQRPIVSLTATGHSACSLF